MESDGVHVVVHCPFSVALLDIEMSSAILKGHWLMKQRPTPPFTALTLHLHVEDIFKCDYVFVLKKKAPSFNVLYFVGVKIWLN